MKAGGSGERALQSVDYGVLLPLLRKLPVNVGDRLAGARGVAHRICDFDWRSAALQQHYVYERTRETMQALVPEAGPRGWSKLTNRRFVNHAREEWEGLLLEDDRAMGAIARDCRTEGVEELASLGRSGRGIVLVSAHLGSFCMGMGLLGMHGIRTHAVASSVVENPAVHPVVTNYFRRKFRAMEGRMGGRCVYHQDDMAYFGDVLGRGEAVVLLIDVPGSKSTVFLPFLGKQLRAPLGCWHLARKTNSVIAAYVCFREGPGRYRLICTPPQEVQGDDPLATLTPLYGHLESWIRQFPDRWLAADLWGAYGDAAS